MGHASFKFTVAPSVFKSRTFRPERRIPQNRHAYRFAVNVWRFVVGVKLGHVRVSHEPVFSGKDLLDILSGFRSGDLNLFNL